MKRHLNTLYVTTEGAWSHKDGENVVVKVDGVERGRVPIHLLGGIVYFGSVGATPALLGHCAKSGVRVSFLDRNGRFLARVDGPQSGNVLLRRSQYRASDDGSECGALAAAMVVGKLLNQRTVVRRALRDHRDSLGDDARSRLELADRHLTSASRNANAATDVDSVRGIEGEGARAYYSAFNDMIRVNDHNMSFRSRSRRPPLDPINALLSFLYTILVHDCRSALETVGLDPYVGFLHRDRPGRASLALDMAEELRSVVADRLALSLVNRKQITKVDFAQSVSGAVALRDDSRKVVLIAYQDRKKDVLRHPFINEKSTIGLVPFLQASIMARRLRGELDGYAPFLWR